jgi:hypothetical protein
MRLVREWYLRRSLQVLIREWASGEVNLLRRLDAATHALPILFCNIFTKDYWILS